MFSYLVAWWRQNVGSNDFFTYCLPPRMPHQNVDRYAWHLQKLGHAQAMPSSAGENELAISADKDDDVFDALFFLSGRWREIR
jgi:hypothetical protein